jgi:hypothetical protein
MQSTPFVPKQLKLFVRWNRNHHDAGGTVELTEEGKTLFTSSPPCGNDERLYGYCRAIVDMMKAIGHTIEMPNCLQGHLGPNRNRED